MPWRRVTWPGGHTGSVAPTTTLAAAFGALPSPSDAGIATRHGRPIGGGAEDEGAAGGRVELGGGDADGVGRGPA